VLWLHQTTDYSGPRDLKNLHEFISDNIPNSVVNIRRPDQALDMLKDANKKGQVRRALISQSI
jgi:hypothetical protein